MSQPSAPPTGNAVTAEAMDAALRQSLAPSQLEVLFPGQGPVQQRVSGALRRQAGETGQGQPAERLWRRRY